MRFLLRYESQGEANGQRLTLGLLVKLTLEPQQGQKTLTLALSAPQVTFQQGETKQHEQEDKLEKALAQSLLRLQLDAQGRVAQLFLPPTLPPAAAALLRMALSPAVFAAPSAGTFTEDEAGGRYEVRYEKSEERLWLRRYQRRLSGAQALITRPGQRGVATQTTVQGVGKLTLAASGFVQTLQHTRSQQTLLGGKQVGTSQETLQLTALPTIVHSRRPVALQNLVATGLLVSLAPEVFERQLKAKTLGSETYTSINALLSGPLRDGKARMSALLKLQALLYLHPELCMRFVESLQPKSARETRFALVTEALASIGTPEAQRALLALLGRYSRDSNTTLRILGCFANLSNPLPESTKALETIAYNPRHCANSGALLALGALAHALTGVQQEVVVDRLEAHLARTKDESEQRLVLLALGNAGSVRSLRTITRFSVHPTPYLRAAAAHALRRLPHEKIRVLLIRLCQDPDPHVRREARFALNSTS
ncbi:HEAT repeat domain-containing protein [Armatimonas sp.]|uniref:HEAT repeat domain-containing protein n=1 Tax=Armatimonas sp. TaxID=1872638 RepID=UPI002869F87A|nr:HEAT repeat domain-containing protein [Armatimonas sp.]